MAMARLRRPDRPGAGAIPVELARFDETEWPCPPGEREGVTGDGAPRFYARRRWQQAQRAWAAAHGMSLPELRAAIAGQRRV
jgi:hypothetical protein